MKALFQSAHVKQNLRYLLGDRITSWIHAFRFYRNCIQNKKAEPELALIPYLVKEGDTVIDIGANNADWTYALAKQVGSTGHVYAFEADPYYAEVTQKTISLLRLKNVTLFPFGLSDKKEDVRLLIRDQNNSRVSGTGRVLNDATSVISEDDTVHVRMERLDDMAIQFPAINSSSFIKCDVEGFELMVMRGSQNVLNKTQPTVVVEFGHAYLHGYSDEDLLNFFWERNYHCYKYEIGTNTFYPVSELRDIGNRSSPNLLFSVQALELT